MIDWSKWGPAKATQERWLTWMEITGWLIALTGLTPLCAQLDYVWNYVNYFFHISRITKPIAPEWPSFWAVVPVVLLGIIWVAMAKAIRASIDNEK